MNNEFIQKAFRTCWVVNMLTSFVLLFLLSSAVLPGFLFKDFAETLLFFAAELSNFLLESRAMNGKIQLNYVTSWKYPGVY